MPDGTIHRKSPARTYAEDKSLTKRRSRSAMLIDAWLLRHEKIFLALLRLDEKRVRRVSSTWNIAPSATHRGYQPPVMIGHHALLAYPGTIIESLDEDDAARQSARLLIKATDEGVIFNLVARIENGAITWDWKSMEAAPELIRDECIKRLLDRAKQLVRVDIPALLAKL